MRNVLPGANTPQPQPKEPKFEAVNLVTSTPKSTEYGVSIPSTYSAKSQASVQTSQRPVSSNDDDNDENAADYSESVDKDVRAFGKRNFGEISNAYLTPYLYNKSFLDKEYGIRNDSDTFMFGDTTFTVDSKIDITIHDKTFRGTKGLWELLTHKKVEDKLI
jgi:hypothetical protein